MARLTRAVLIAAPLCLTAFASGCGTSSSTTDQQASSSSTVDRPSEVEIRAADAELEQGLAEIREYLTTCEARGECSGAQLGEAAAAFDGAEDDGLRVADVDGKGTVRPQGWGIPEWITKPAVCRVLWKLRDWSRPYFFVGASVNGTARGSIMIGADIVWDLWNRQSAGFWYYGAGSSTGLGVGAELYEGIGLSKVPQDDVVSAWSGPFATATFGFSLPLVPTGTARIGASISKFRSYSGTSFGDIYGTSFSITASLGFKIVPPGPSVTGSASTADWHAYDALTEQHRGFLGFGTTFTTTGSRRGKAIRYANGNEVSKSILKSVPPPLSLVPSLGALGFGILKDKGWTYAQYCEGVAPRRARAVSNPQRLPAK
jgi:hypothetical protein